MAHDPFVNMGWRGLQHDMYCNQPPDGVQDDPASLLEVKLSCCPSLYQGNRQFIIQNLHFFFTSTQQHNYNDTLNITSPSGIGFSNTVRHDHTFHYYALHSYKENCLQLYDHSEVL